MSAVGTGAALRLHVIGDELAAGAGDPKALGWCGRVVARTGTPTTPTALVLAVPHETSTALAERWQDEVARRLSAPDEQVTDRLVVALGAADISAGLSIARSRLNLANIVDAASARGLHPFVVGPAPVDPQAVAQYGALSAAFADVAGRRGVPFVDLVTPLAHHDQWLSDLAAQPDGLPGQAGHGLIAWLVLHSGWHAWLGLPDAAGA